MPVPMGRMKAQSWEEAKADAGKLLTGLDKILRGAAPQALLASLLEAIKGLGNRGDSVSRKS